MTTNSWMPRDRWNALIRGDGCPLCAQVQASSLADDYGFVIADLQFSRLRLVRNQYVTGYCVLICHKHVIEPHELTASERNLFFADLALVGQALQQVFQADKLNFQMLGNAVPHLHAHIVPRYFGDPAPSRPIDPTPAGQEVFLTEAGYDERIQAIQRELRIDAVKGS